MIRFYNGKVLTMHGDMTVTDDEVWVDDDKIAYVGKDCTEQADQEIDLHGNLLMPSFKNAHTHSAMTFLRSYADDLPLASWLNDRVFPMEARLRPGDIAPLSALAFAEYLTSGCTACFDMYYFQEETARASVESGFRTVFTCGLNNFQESVEKLEEYYNRFNSYDKLIAYRLGFHAEYTTSGEIMQGVAKLAHKYEAPVFMHASETKSEVDDCKKRWGKTPAALFEDLGLWDFGGGAYHSVWVSDDDLEIYKRKNIWAVINAGSNCKLASGVAPVQKMMDMGIPIAVGTDGPASNNCLDMFKEMFLIAASQKLLLHDAAACDADKILYAATAGSAHCMGLADCDTIAPGKQADLIVIDLHRPNMQPINNITKNLVYAGSKENVKMTMCAGKILYENGECKTIDTEKVYREAQAVIDRMR